MRYEEVVRRICGEDWKTVNISEREGGIGVACVVAYMKGARPSVGEMASHLGIPSDDVYMPFQRLSRHGVFSDWDIKKDKALLSQLGDDEAQRAWAHIAALASGFIGV